MNEFDARDLIVEMARSMFERRLTFGSSGNISVKIDDGWLMTPTGSSLGRLDPSQGELPSSRHVPRAGNGGRRGSPALHPFRCRVMSGRHQP